MKEEKIRISPIIFAVLLIIILLIIAIGRRINENKKSISPTNETTIEDENNTIELQEMIPE